MGWLIFFGLMLIGSICVGIERLAQGQINGLWYVLVPVVIIVICIIALISQNNNSNKSICQQVVNKRYNPKMIHLMIIGIK